MKPKTTHKAQTLRSSGFVACYKGEAIAVARDFDALANKAEVKALLDKKDFVIKHTVPEGMLAVY